MPDRPDISLRVSSNACAVVIEDGDRRVRWRCPTPPKWECVWRRGVSSVAARPLLCDGHLERVNSSRWIVCYFKWRVPATA